MIYCSYYFLFFLFNWMLLFRHSVMSNSLRRHGLQHARLPVFHCLPELAQTHVHWANDATQPSFPVSSPFPSAFCLSQHQGLFQWVSSLHQVAKVLELQLWHQSCQWIFRVISFRNDCANLDYMLYLAVTDLSVCFLYCEFPDLLKLGQESSYLYKRYLI